MAIDEIPEHEQLPLESPAESSHTIWFAVIFAMMAALVWGEFHTLSKINSISAQQTLAEKRLSAQVQVQISDQFTALERMNAQQLDSLKVEIDAASQRAGTAGKEFHRARAMVTKLQKEQAQQAAVLRSEIEKKADQQQVSALTQDVSTTKDNLDSTKKSVDTLAQNLGMARSELGTLIARNHDEVEELRRLGERDYFEFKLERKHPQRVAGVLLDLKKTNVKRHRYSLALTADDVETEKKDRTVNEPIFFYVQGSKKPYELVVNRVESEKLEGYVSAPKGAAQMASRM